MRVRSLRDLDATDGTVQLQETSSSTNKIILVPKPSATDPNDPLRWPRAKKHIAFTSICAFTFFTNFGISGLAPAFYILSKEFDKSLAQTSHLLLYPILVLGVFNFFWVPLANYLGKRPVFVFASGLLCACSIWGARAQSFESLLWSNIVAAFAGSSTETLGVAIVNDLYFLHERGAKMGIYMNAISGGNTLGPLICGFIVTNLSWRWHKWIAVIFTAVNFVCIVLFVPETRYDCQRSRVDEIDVQHSEEKHAQENTVPAGQASDASFQQMPKKTVTQELGLWSGRSHTNLFKMFIRPQINGLINIPGALGNLFGSWAGGDLVDWWCKRRTKANHGVYEPESRLYMLAIPLLLTSMGVFFGYGLIAVALTAVPTVTLAYVSDCALPVNSDALLLVNGLKNIVAFGFLYGVVPWVDQVGYVKAFGTMAGIYVAIVGLGMVMLIVFGSQVRHTSAQWRIILE
ncbi:hypothetical protein ACEQ8H_002545 [Pleosporales sp. CAS-2024a]